MYSLHYMHYCEVFLFLANGERRIVQRDRRCTIHLPIITKKSLSLLSGTYGKDKHCLSNVANGSGGCRSTNRLMRCGAPFVRSCVLQLQQRSTCPRILFVYRIPDNRELWIAVSFKISYYCYQWIDEGLNN